jgi:hypothetical protein
VQCSTIALALYKVQSVYKNNYETTKIVKAHYHLDGPTGQQNTTENLKQIQVCKEIFSIMMYFK